MSPTPRHRDAETAFRKLIADGDLAEPDQVEYTDASVVFLWHDPRLIVYVDLDDDEPVAAQAA